MPKPDFSQYGNHKPISDALAKYLKWRAEKGEKPDALRWKVWEGTVVFEAEHQQQWEAYEAGFEDGNSLGYGNGYDQGYVTGQENA